MNKPTINDYPQTDARTFKNLNGTVNWKKYADALDAYIAAVEVPQPEKEEKVSPLDEMFRFKDEEDLRTMTKDEYITKARDFIGRIDKLYWSNWSWRTLTDDELPEESLCDNCNEGCVVKQGDLEYDCVPDHADGVCRIRIFDEGNYADEMGAILEEFVHYEMLDTEIQLTN